MLVLPGSSALSDARFELLATEMAALGGGCVLREVVHAYVVDVTPEHTVNAERLAALLHPGTAAAADARRAHPFGAARRRASFRNDIAMVQQSHRYRPQLRLCSH